MAITSLLPLMLLVASCYCAPHKYGGGFGVGGKSELDWKVGGNLAGDVDGMSVDGGGNGVLGATWRGTGYGGGYGVIDDNYYGAQGAATASLGGALRPGFSGAAGRTSEGKYKLGLTPTFGITKEAGIGANGKLATGDDAKRIAARYGGGQGFGGF